MTIAAADQISMYRNMVLDPPLRGGRRGSLR